MLRFSAFVHGDSANKNGRRDTAVDVAMALVGTLLVRGKGGNAGGVGSFDNSVEVEGGFVHLVAEVGEVEGYAASLQFNAGHKFTDLNFELDGVDVDNIIVAGVAGI